MHLGCKIPLATETEPRGAHGFSINCDLPDFQPDLSTAARECATYLGYASHSRWLVLDTPSQLDDLAASLVERGFREGGLKKELVHGGILDNIKEIISIVKQKQERKTSSIVAPDLTLEEVAKSANE